MQTLAHFLCQIHNNITWVLCIQQNRIVEICQKHTHAHTKAGGFFLFNIVHRIVSSGSSDLQIHTHAHNSMCKRRFSPTSKAPAPNTIALPLFSGGSGTPYSCSLHSSHACKWICFLFLCNGLNSIMLKYVCVLKYSAWHAYSSVVYTVCIHANRWLRGFLEKSNGFTFLSSMHILSSFRWEKRAGAEYLSTLYMDKE